MWIKLRSSLTAKLLVSTVLALLVLISIATLLADNAMHKTLLLQLDKTFESHLHSAIQEIKREVSHIQNTAQVLASNPIIRKALDRDVSRGMNSHLNIIMSSYPELNYLLLVDRQLDIFAINTINRNKKKMPAENLLAETISTHTLYNPLMIEVNQHSEAGHDEFLQTLNLGSAVSMWVTAPVVVRGKIKGILVLSMQWQKVIEGLLQNQAELLKSQGYELEGISILNNKKEVLAGSYEFSPDVFDRMKPLTLGREEYSLHMQYNNAQVDELIYDQRQRLLTVVIPLFILICIALYYLLRHQVLKRIKTLSFAIDQFSKKDLKSRVEVEGSDEISGLMNAFNVMGKQIYKSRLNLEEKVDKRTFDLSQVNEKLKEAVEDAKQASLAKSEFLASMSHEIRTPMNGVLGMLGLLMKSELTDEQRRKASIANSSAMSLLSLINDILDFSKVEAGKLELEHIDFNLYSLLTEFTEAMALRAHEKKVEVILDVNNVELVLVKGDPGRLRQILTNLVGNAIKFTDSGEIVIRAKLTSAGELGILFTCSIKDSGIGIPEEKQAALFDVFTQVDASTTRHFGGTGLGLSIVKKLCELMGGSVSVDSKINQGSCFEFSVLLQQSTKKIKSIPKINFSNLHVLLVDDNETNREVMRAQLESWGAKVDEAESAAATLRLLEQRFEEGLPLYDAAFLDMQMPEMNGAQLGQAIKESRHFNGLKLIMMTSTFNEGGEAEYFSSLGFSAYFSKPVTPSDLFDALTVVAAGGEVLSEAAPLVTHSYLQTLKHDDVSQNKAKILLVEDNLINQEVALAVLNDLGFKNVVLAGDGLIAIEKLKTAQVPFDLVLMDCQMPLLDGYQATQKIREGQAGDKAKNICIIAMTANAMKEDKEKCLSAGMSDYLSKPIDTDLLNEKIQSALKNT